MTKTLELENGGTCLVDDEDLTWLLQWRWRKKRVDNNVYVYRRKGADIIYMHAEILPCVPGTVPDHINGHGLDNRRANLRPATRSQNAMNQPAQQGRKYKGVSWNKDWQMWSAKIRAGGKSLFLGYHDTQEQAAREYDKAAVKYHGEFARLNFPASAGLDEPVT